MRKLLLSAVCLCAFAAPSFANDDLNHTDLRGRVVSVKNHIATGGVFRVEVQLFVQSPTGGPYSPSFYCSPSIWSDCEVSDLITGCTPVCESTEGPDDTKIENCHCGSFNPGAGACLEVEPYHDGFGLLANSVSVVSTCKPLP